MDVSYSPQSATITNPVVASMVANHFSFFLKKRAEALECKLLTHFPVI